MTESGNETVFARRNLLICAGIAVCCAAIYGQTLGFGFVNYDDGLYVTENQHVQAGLGWSNLVWSFTTERAMYFHPLTWLSHTLDCQLYGLRAGGHHLTNFVIHTIDAVLLFLVLSRMTRAVWPSAFAAALFGVHPLHVESVAWVAERKDVLSAFFWIAAMGAHARYCRQRNAANYALTAAMFALGFASKPMVVTLPFVLLLLDYWPLERYDRGAPLREMLRRFISLCIEKIPFFVLTGAMCALTVIMQQRGNNLSYGDKVLLPARIANAIVVYVLYLVKTVWPTGLAFYYPHPLTRPAWQVAGAAIVLIAISLLCLREMRRRPYLIVGWLWYLGVLLPVIELVQAGSFSHADRYTYLPHIGIFMAVAWWGAELAASWRIPARAMAVAAIAITIAYTACAANQARHWRNSETLMRHALEVTSNSALAHNNLGVELFVQGRRAEAVAEYEKAVAIDPENYRALDNLGAAMYEQGKYAEAEAYHRKALAILPRYVAGHVNLGMSLKGAGRLDEAEQEFKRALELDPESVRAHCALAELDAARGKPDAARAWYERVFAINPNAKAAHMGLAELLVAEGKPAEAAARFERVLQNDPRESKAHYNLGTALEVLGRPRDAAAAYAAALQWNPSFAQAHNNLGRILANAQAIDEALTHYQQAIALDPGYAEAHNNLANMLIMKKRMGEAEQHYLEALRNRPGYTSARLNLAQLLIELARPDEARAQLQKVLEADPANEAARKILAGMGASHGDPAPR